MTSAVQLLDVTDAITFSDSNATSSNEAIYTLKVIEEREIKTLGPNIERQKFKETLRKTITKDISILKELSKY